MSTDTRAALEKAIEKELRVCVEMCARATAQGVGIDPAIGVGVAHLTTLARSAPEERGEGERLTLTVDQVWAFEQIHNAGLSDDQYEAWQIVWRYLTRAASPPAPSRAIEGPRG